MRITGGFLKGRPLKFRFPDHVRPTTDFSRESLFNYLSNHFSIEKMNVLDLFSGSGIMALEFISRGSPKVLSVDSDPKNHKIYQQISSEWRLNEIWENKKNKVEDFISKSPIEAFSVIFADPPYDMPNIQNLPNLCMPLLKDEGIMILEHKPDLVFPIKFTVQKQYGSSAFTIFAKTNS